MDRRFVPVALVMAWLAGGLACGQAGTGGTTGTTPSVSPSRTPKPPPGPSERLVQVRTSLTWYGKGVPGWNVDPLRGLAYYEGRAAEATWTASYTWTVPPSILTASGAAITATCRIVTSTLPTALARLTMESIGMAPGGRAPAIEAAWGPGALSSATSAVVLAPEAGSRVGKAARFVVWLQDGPAVTYHYQYRTAPRPPTPRPPRSVPRR